MSSGRAILKEFINKYKELECLWNVHNKYYKNKRKRELAREQLAEILRKIDKDANADSASRKINCLRSCFNKEHNKVIASYRSGSGIDDLHIPKLWYYESLLFLTETDSRKSTTSTTELNETINDTLELEETYLEPDSPHSHSSDSTNMSEQNMQHDNIAIINKKSLTSETDIDQDIIIKTESGTRKRKRSFTKEVATISSRQDSPVSPSKPKYTAFGEHVAEKLRAMPRDMASYCQKMINDAIFHADFGNLNETSRIVTDFSQRF